MNLSFSLTTPQMRARAKTVTRRFTKRIYRVGQVVTAIEKGQGIPKGGHVVKICQIRIVGVTRERADAIVTNPKRGQKSEVALEGFPGMTPEQFLEMLCKANKRRPDEVLTRIEFEYI